MALTLVTAPTMEPITLAEAKEQIRVDIETDDARIRSLIQLAREVVQDMSLHALITQTWNYTLHTWPAADRFALPLPPLQSVVSIAYKDEDGNNSTFSATSYIVDTDRIPGQVVLAYGESWPGGTLYPVNAITVQFTCGFGDEGNDVAQRLRQAMLLLIGHWYENREETVAVGNIQHIPFGVASLLWEYEARAITF